MSRGVNRPASVQSARITFPRQHYAYTFEIDEWNQIRGYLNHLTIRATEEIAKELLDPVSKAWLEKLKRSLNDQKNILDILRKIKLAPVNGDVCEYLKQLERRQTLTNTEHLATMQGYLNRLDKFKISLTDKLITTAEYRMLLKFMEKDCAMIKGHHFLSMQAHNNQILDTNLEKLRKVNDAFKIIEVEWNDTMYAQGIDRLGTELAYYCTTELPHNCRADNESQFDHFDAEFIILTADIGTIEPDMDKMIKNIIAQLSEASGLYSLLSGEKPKNLSFNKLKDHLKDMHIL